MDAEKHGLAPKSSVDADAARLDNELIWARSQIRLNRHRAGHIGLSSRSIEGAGAMNGFTLNGFTRVGQKIHGNVGVRTRGENGRGGPAQRLP